MLLISKSISQLILPPGGLILMALLGLIFYKKAWGRGLIGLALLLLFLLSTAPVRDMLTSPLEMKYPAFSLQNEQQNLSPEHTAIVVLGGGIQANSLEHQGEDTLSRFAMMRAVYAAKIAKTTPLDLYPTGGAPLSQGVEAEGIIMQRWLIWLGIDASRIHAENQANTTWDNAVLSQAMLAKQGIHTVVLVTSAWHMPRAVWCFEAQGLQVIPAPTDYFTTQKAYDIRSFLPKWSTFAESGAALHEYLGFFWYKLKYNHPTRVQP